MNYCTAWKIPCLSLLFAASISNAGIRFTEISAAAGLTHSIGGEGVCVFDYDNDGWEDIFLADFYGRNRLYRNLGNMTFQEVAASAGVDSSGHARLAIAGDFNNDGFLDLFVGCHVDPSWLYLNNGDGTFTDITSAAGIVNSSNVRGCAWFDYDQDGWLDLYVTNLIDANLLCHNNGDNTFTDIAASVNAQGPTPSGLIMGMACVDYDRDGDEDLFLAQDGNRGNLLFQREPGGSFTDVSQTAGVSVGAQGMGVAVGDYNRDGNFDVHITNLDENTLFQNQGDGTFQDVTQFAGVGDSAASMGWGTFFFDADNDGWLDIYNNNQSGFGQVPNSFYHNLGNGIFEDQTLAAGLWVWNDGIGSAFADLDNDGDLDIVLTGYPAAAGNIMLFRNDSNEPHSWIQFTLKEPNFNQYAIGAIVELYTADGVQTSFVGAGNGYISQNTLRQHFGLGSLSVIDSVVVHWPGGARENFGAPPVNQHHELLKGSSTTGVADLSGVPSDFQLLQNFPNPFNPSTEIRYTIPQLTGVTLRVYDVLGREIATLVDEEKAPGDYVAFFEPTVLSSGMYIYRLEAGTFRESRKMLLLR